MEVYLVRHGQSEANASLSRDLDTSLTPLGRLQAERTAERLVGEVITWLGASPLKRTMETMVFIADRLDLPVTVFSGVHEYFAEDQPEYLAFEGLTFEAIQERFVRVRIDSDFPCEARWWPALENPRMAFGRAERTRDALIEAFGHTDRKILIVSHADPIGWLILAFQRLPEGKEPYSIENGAISHLMLHGDKTLPSEVVIIDDFSHCTNAQ